MIRGVTAPAHPAVVPGTYLQDGARLIQVLAVDGRRLVCEDVAAPADEPAPVVPVVLGEVLPPGAPKTRRGWRVVRGPV